MTAPAAASARRSAVADLRHLLRGKGFRRLFPVRLASQAGDGAFQAGLAGLFFFSPERSATAAGVATAFAVTVLPWSLLGPFAGALLDRRPRRDVLLAANLLRAAVVVLVAALVLGGAVRRGGGLLAVLSVLVLVSLSVNRFFLAGLGAGLPHVVAGAELVTANALFPTAGTLAALAGGVAGLGVRTALGAGDRTDAVVVLLGAVGYLASAALTLRMPRPLLGPDDADADAVPIPLRRVAAGAARDLVAALAHLRRRPDPARALGAIAGHRLAYGGITVATVLLCRGTLADPADVARGAATLGLVLGAVGAGLAAAAVVTPVVTERVRPDRVVPAGLVVAALAWTAVTLAPRVPVAVAAGVVLGLGTQAAKICVDTIVQAGVDDEVRGRVMSLYDLAFSVTFVAAAAVAALLLPPDGHAVPVLLGLAAVYLAAAAAYAAAGRGRSRPAP